MMPPSQGKKIVLTSDETMMSSYHGGVMLGFAAIMPKRALPDFVFHKFFCPPVPAAADGSAALAPCGMRKVEAALLEAGFSRDEVMVAHPLHLDRAIGPDTKVVGITHDDPMGKIAVREIEEIIGRGPPFNRSKFLELLTHPLIQKHKPAVVLGGNGAWEALGEKVGVDVIYLGEAESDFPDICRKIISGESVPPVIRGRAVPGEDIPACRGATIGGIVEIGRGCWRGCAFCSPANRVMRHRPVDDIIKDVQANLESGQKDIILHSEDFFSYGYRSAGPDQRMILDLVRAVKRQRPKTIDVSHLSLASVYQNQNLLRQVSEIVGVGSDQNHMSAWIGIESGSCRILRMHMPNKARPAEIEDWPEIVRECYSLFAEESWLPVASLVLGLPGERAEDVIKTTELVDSLMDYTGLMLPLFFTTIADTKLGGSKGFSRQDALPEHWQLVGLCLEYNLRHLKKLHRFYQERMTAGFGVHLALRGINLLADIMLSKYIKRMKRGEPPN
ncbi:MAG: B12-binding domain-containing radical SAM protein [Methanothrix sp.]|nr:B12-binding domain-containing radical SAM protein [Methanothrix sp.]